MPDGNELQQNLLRQYGLRVEPRMLEYLQGRMLASPGDSVSLIGGESRTGTPMRVLVEPAKLSIGDGDSRKTSGTS